MPQKFPQSSASPSSNPPRRVAGGARIGIQQRYETARSSGLAAAIYSPPAVAGNDAESGDPIGQKPNMVDNIYEPPVNKGKGLPSGADFFKNWWYGISG